MYQVNLLWDIDGTLLDTHGLGVKPLENAIRAEFQNALSLIRGKFSGYTDFEIISELSETDINNPVNHECYSRIIAAYADSLRIVFEEKSATSIGDVSNVLLELKNFPSIKSYIGTGNYEMTGWLKLQSAALDKFFTPKKVFGGDLQRMRRSEIIKYAKNELGGQGIPIIIGDSPSDVYAAKLNGVEIIGVPTGHHDFSTLNHLIPGRVLSPTWKFDELLQKIEDVAGASAL
jgi:phosphoglycolate phosphatase-like HAD superfamily hydrolase